MLSKHCPGRTGARDRAATSSPPTSLLRSGTDRLTDQRPRGRAGRWAPKIYAMNKKNVPVVPGIFDHRSLWMPTIYTGTPHQVPLKTPQDSDHAGNVEIAVPKRTCSLSIVLLASFVCGQTPLTYSKQRGLVPKIRKNNQDRSRFYGDVFCVYSVGILYWGRTHIWSIHISTCLICFRVHFLFWYVFFLGGWEMFLFFSLGHFLATCYILEQKPMFSWI